MVIFNFNSSRNLPAGRQGKKIMVSLRTKIYCLFILFLVVFMIGCSSQGEQFAKDSNRISIWHWMTDRQQAFDTLAKKYEAKTGIKVSFELYAPSDAYSQKVRAAAQGQTLPDIFGILGEKMVFASFIKAGHILDLTPYMEENKGDWKNKFFAKALAVNEFSDGNSYGIKTGLYGAPIDVVAITILYNKDLFKKLGLNPDKPPVTFQEFLDIGKKIKQANMQGLVSGWAETWMIDCFANNYAFNIMGKDKVLATIRGEVAYTDPDWVKVLTLFKEMQDSGVLANGVVGMINKNAEQLFANGRAVFAFNGSWCVNVYREMNPNLDYGAILPPKVSEKYNMSIWAGAGSSFTVNANSKKKEEAVKFLKWLTDKDQQAYLAQATQNLPANKESVKEMQPVLAQFADRVEYSTHPNVWEVSEYPAVIEAFDKGIQSIIIQEKTPEQVALEVQKIKERELSRKRN